ncbi:MAG: carbohydrate porin [Akkermansiaceae bacterium]
MNYRLLLFSTVFTATIPCNLNAESRDGGPDSVDALLEDQRSEKESLLEQDFFAPYGLWKESVAKKTGFSWGTDYSAQYFTASDSPGDSSAGGGMFRLYGSWDFLNRGEKNTGGLRFKVEHRHGYTDTTPSGYQLNLGSVGVMGGPFNDNGVRLTNLYWRQQFGDRMVGYFGLLDVTDFVDVYGLGSPWTAFTNLNFSTGSASMALPNDAAPGLYLGGWLNDKVYISGGLAALNSDPRDPVESFERAFDESEFFKFVEIGWTSSKERFYFDNVHLTFWHVDEIADTSTPDGWGVNFSSSFWVNDTYMPFFRAGYADDGGSLLELSMNAGVAWNPRKDDLFGIAANWGQPNASTFGPGLDDQYGMEIFYRSQITENLRLTPSVQLLANPALNPSEDLALVFGARGVLSF